MKPTPSEQQAAITTQTLSNSVQAADIQARLDQIPRQALANLPTPIEQVVISNSSTVTGAISDADLNQSNTASLWVKRDDLTHTTYGGNKVRKLEYILADVARQQCTEVVTFGGLGTNHGVATALFCQQLGIKCTVLLFDQPITDAVITNLKLMQQADANLIFCGSLFNTALRFYAGRLVPSPTRYYLEAGGSNVYGCLGFVRAAFELKEQIDQGLLSMPDRIICPVGSSGTLAGLSLGCQLAGLSSDVIGIRVAPSHLGPIPICTTQSVNSLKKRLYRFLRKQCSIPEIALTPIALLDEYYGEGYGVPSSATRATITAFAQSAIRLDTTYTAKAAAAALDDCLRQPDKTVLYWHTYNSADVSELEGRVNASDLPDNIAARLRQHYDNKGS